MRAAVASIAAALSIVVAPSLAGLKARTTTVVVHTSRLPAPTVVVQAFRPAVSVAQDFSPAPQPARQPALRIGVARPGGYTVRALPIDEYVAGVLAGEAARESAPSALEALAITVRTFAVANLSRHRADGFDLCDQTHCQVLRAATLATERAAAATTGKVLLYQGAPASVFYSASCGGRTERPSEVWPGAQNPEFLPSRDDDACGGTPVWTAALSSPDLIRALRAAGFTGSALRDVRIVGRNTSGRVTELRLEGLSPDHISGQDLRVVVGRTLGWQHIKSTAFDLGRTGAVYQFSGHGSGHGVGLCVIGSARLGARGQTPPQILARYFPGAAIALMPASVVAALEPAAGAPRAARPEAPRAGEPPRAPIAAAPRAASASAPAAAVPDVIIALPEGDEGERDRAPRRRAPGAKRARPGSRRRQSAARHAAPASDRRELPARDGAAVVHRRRDARHGDSPGAADRVARARRAGADDSPRDRPPAHADRAREPSAVGPGRYGHLLCGRGWRAG